MTVEFTPPVPLFRIARLSLAENQVHFCREGETASEGIRLMAELGSQPRLLSEVNAAIANGTAHFTLSGGGINPAPGSRRLVLPQALRRDYPRVTLCSMIAPSPDWFVGVDSLSLLEDGAWATPQTAGERSHRALRHIHFHATGLTRRIGLGAALDPRVTMGLAYRQLQLPSDSA